MFEMMLKALGITPQAIEEFRAAFIAFITDAKQMQKDVADIRADIAAIKKHLGVDDREPDEFLVIEGKKDGVQTGGQ